MRRRLRVVYFGRADYFASVFLDEIRRAHDVVGIVEARAGHAKAPGRGRSLIDLLRGRGSLQISARRWGVPYRYLPPGSTAAAEALIDGVQPDAGCIASFPCLLPPKVFERFPLGVLNYHPSLLPAYRGPLPLLWQYFFQEPRMGVTIHLIDAREDTGDILSQQELPVALGEPIHRVERRFATAGASMMRDALSALADGVVVRTPQRHLPCPFRARVLRSQERMVDPDTWPVERVYHFLRGAAPSFEQTPQPDFPLDLFDWRPTAFDHVNEGRTPVGRVGRRGLRLFVQYKHGRIWLRPHAGAAFIRRSLRRRRARQAGHGASLRHPA